MTCDGSPSCCRCIGWVLMRFAAAGRVVTFPGPQGPQEAAAVVEALSNQPFEPAGGRTLVCKFAKWVPEPGAPQEDPQVGNCSERLCVELFCCTPQLLQLNDHCGMCLITAGVTGVVCCSDNVAGRVCDASAAHCTDSSSGPGRAWQGVGMGGDHHLANHLAAAAGSGVQHTAHQHSLVPHPCWSTSDQHTAAPIC